MNKTGLYFGSFNPIHIGHLIIANHLLEYSDLDKIWFVISPQNPLKKKANLLEDHHRLALVKIAIDDNPNFKASNIEFALPKPSYTINTLVYLEDKYPKQKFCLIMGEDNLQYFDKWKNYEQIIKNYAIYVYPRPNSKNLHFASHPNVNLINAPLIEISASFIRQAIKENKDIRYLLHPSVYKYIDEMNFYK
ncbi:MAG: nicotinic acid mononucleotide adenylyltransferase [Bacteroidetes bacterium HGW-Bacteroidetes-12]|nr:MAG: nicotinic acid mononucleotide adenylyltransferase [Bacteroidetes bacterium HGW-Bacteroidetes-12]